MKKCFVLVLALSLLIGCAKEGPMGPAGPKGENGSQGPTGPQGPAGPGTKYIYSARISNVTTNGYYDLPCPAAMASSSVTCYIFVNNNDNVELGIPAAYTETNGSATFYAFSVSVGVVRFSWANMNNSIPSITAVKTVIIN